MECEGRVAVGQQSAKWLKVRKKDQYTTSTNPSFFTGRSRFPFFGFACVVLAPFLWRVYVALVSGARCVRRQSEHNTRNQWFWNEAYFLYF